MGASGTWTEVPDMEWICRPAEGFVTACVLYVPSCHAAWEVCLACAACLEQVGMEEAKNWLSGYIV